MYILTKKQICEQFSEEEHLPGVQKRADKFQKTQGGH